ncbi:MAG: hypothetical protein EZS28_030751, partial [Streblomastix strix]
QQYFIQDVNKDQQDAGKDGDNKQQQQQQQQQSQPSILPPQGASDQDQGYDGIGQQPIIGQGDGQGQGQGGISGEDARKQALLNVPKQPPQIPLPPLPQESGVLIDRVSPGLSVFAMMFASWNAWCEETLNGFATLYSTSMDRWQKDNEAELNTDTRVAKFGEEGWTSGGKRDVNKKSLFVQPSAQHPEQSTDNGQQQDEEEDPMKETTKTNNNQDDKPQLLGSEEDEGRDYNDQSGREQDDNYYQQQQQYGDGDDRYEEGREQSIISPNQQVPFYISVQVRRFLSDTSMSALFVKQIPPPPKRWKPKKLISHKPIIEELEPPQLPEGEQQDDQAEEEENQDQAAVDDPNKPGTDNQTQQIPLIKFGDGGPIGKKWRALANGLEMGEIVGRKKIGEKWWEDSELTSEIEKRLFNQAVKQADGVVTDAAKREITKKGQGQGQVKGGNKGQVQLTEVEADFQKQNEARLFALLPKSEQKLRQIALTTLTYDPMELAKRHNSRKAQEFVHRLHQQRQAMRSLEWLSDELKRVEHGGGDAVTTAASPSNTSKNTSKPHVISSQGSSDVDKVEIRQNISIWLHDRGLWPVELPARLVVKSPLDIANEYAQTIVSREVEKLQREKEEREREDERKRKEKEEAAALKAAKKKKKK